MTHPQKRVRKRKAYGVMEDDKIEAPTNVHPSTSKVRLPTEPVVEPIPPKPTSTGSCTPNPAQSTGERKQGASVFMAAFQKMLPTLQAAMLAKEFDNNLGSLCQCGCPDAKYRCQSCAHSPLRCKSCILVDHQRTPWHHIDAWHGTHFTRTSLQQLGFRYCLGHGGEVCPNRQDFPSEQFVVTPTNGFHVASFEFCQCHGSGTPADQLLKEYIFPSSFERPETAFTFELLDTFEKISLKSKMNAYDYHLSLQELTNAAFPQEVPNRYHEFMRAFRVWMHLAQVRRSGQSHDIDDVFPYRRKGSITVRCLACPEVHFNLDKETLDAAHEDEKHKYTLFISAHGNFKLQWKNKQGDPDNVSLNNGRGYFVANEPYQDYLSIAGDVKEDTICAHLRAVKFRNVIRFKNAVVSGVIVMQCAQHGFYLPEGVADLKVGEAFRNTDWVLFHSLADAHEQRWIMLGYDILCAYIINLRNRCAKYFGDMLDVVNNIRGAVPSLHIRNHNDKCQYLYAFSHIPKSGRTQGELVEGTHSEQNGAAPSTKEMNSGCRHDFLDAFIHYWNWSKFHKMAPFLYRVYVKTLDELKTREKSFYEFNSRFDAGVIKKWEAIDETPKKVNKVVISPHRSRYKLRPPTQSKVHQTLTQEEYISELAGVGVIGEAGIVSTGLNLERDQREIQVLKEIEYPSEEDTLKLVKLRGTGNVPIIVYNSPLLEDSVFCTKWSN